jgi:polyhydroxyalkanoate synthase subunit PhaC
MQDELLRDRAGGLPAERSERAKAQAQPALTFEHAKAPNVAPIAPSPRTGAEPLSLRSLDRLFRGMLARATQGISPNALAKTWADWAVHIAQAPGKRLELVQRAAMTAGRLNMWLPYSVADGNRTPPFAPVPGDRRFSDPRWSQWPFNVFVQNFLGAEAWWAEATRNVPGLERDREAEVTFVTRILVDMVSPSNIPWMNPASIAKTAEKGGLNLIRGAANWLDDFDRSLGGKPPAGAEKFEVVRVWPSWSMTLSREGRGID